MGRHRVLCALALLLLVTGMYLQLSYSRWGMLPYGARVTMHSTMLLPAFDSCLDPSLGELHTQMITCTYASATVYGSSVLLL